MDQVGQSLRGSSLKWDSSTLTQSNLIRSSQAGIDSLVNAKGFLDKIKSLGPTAVIGGAPRDWLFGLAPRDVDLVVDCVPSALDAVMSEYDYEGTAHGGYRLTGSIPIDIWALSSTTAFRLTGGSSFEDLALTAFFNIDSIMVRLDNWQVIDGGFFDGFSKRTLSINFEANPYPFICAVRGLALLRKYDLKLGQDCLDYIDKLATDQKFRWSTISGLFYKRFGATPDLDFYKSKLPAKLMNKLLKSKT